MRLKVELVLALECVASVALHDGHDHALLAGQHGVPELGQERVDVVGERLQLKTFAALEEAALFLVAKRHASSVQIAKCSITSSKRDHLRRLRQTHARCGGAARRTVRKCTFKKKGEIFVEKEGPAASPHTIGAC